MALGPGHHLFIDARARGPISKEQLFWFLSDCPDRIGMTRITSPNIGRAEGVMAGFVIIAESHISVHIKDHEGDRPAVFIDVFSCKPIPDLQVIVDFATEKLGLNPESTFHRLIIREMPE